MHQNNFFRMRIFIISIENYLIIKNSIVRYDYSYLIAQKLLLLNLKPKNFKYGISFVLSHQIHELRHMRVLAKIRTVDQFKNTSLC